MLGGGEGAGQDAPMHPGTHCRPGVSQEGCCHLCRPGRGRAGVDGVRRAGRLCWSVSAGGWSDQEAARRELDLTPQVGRRRNRCSAEGSWGLCEVQRTDLNVLISRPTRGQLSLTSRCISLQSLSSGYFSVMDDIVRCHLVCKSVTPGLRLLRVAQVVVSCSCQFT